MNKISKFIISIIVCEAVGLLATPFTIASIPTWYVYLNKPSFSPPNWLFGPVWATLYLLMGVSVYVIWNKSVKSKKIREALTIFIIQLILNFLWSVLFFGLHSPELGLVDIVLLLAAIVITIIKFYKISQLASFLLIPYLLWVSFATVLNVMIVRLNP